MVKDISNHQTTLVTGCAGFIGSKIAELLLERGDIVVGVDNLNNAYHPSLKEWRLAQPRHPADVLATWVDISKAKELLGWRPLVSIEEGIQKTVAWYKEAQVKDTNESV